MSHNLMWPWIGSSQPKNVGKERWMATIGKDAGPRAVTDLAAVGLAS